MTPAELKRAALDRLDIPGGFSDDVAIVTSKYDGLYAELRTRNLAMWAIDGDVPADVQNAVVAMLAFASAGEFLVPEPRYSRLRLEGALGDSPPSLAERQMRQVLGAAYVPVPVKTEYF